MAYRYGLFFSSMLISMLTTRMGNYIQTLRQLLSSRHPNRIVMTLLSFTCVISVRCVFTHVASISRGSCAM